jgi:hypothetical protein
LKSNEERSVSETPYAPPTALVADPPDPSQVRIGRYVAIFTAALTAAIAAVLLVVAFTDYEPNGSIGLLEMLFAASLTGMLFVRNNERIPTVAERRKLIWMSFAASLLVVLIPTGGFLGYLAFRFGVGDVMQGISETIPRLPLFVWAIIVLITLGLTYVSLHLGYGFITTRFGKQLAKKNAL